MSDFNFTEDVLDVRYLIERFEELENEKDSMLEDVPASEYGNKENKPWMEWENSDIYSEFNQLKGILEELCGRGGDEQWRGDWYPITLINSDYFTEYTKELVEDCGYIRRGEKDKELPWWISIDWEDTADNVKDDYTSIDIGNETYYYR